MSHEPHIDIELVRTFADQIVRDVAANAYLWRTLDPACRIPAGRGWSANDETIAFVVDHLQSIGRSFTLLELGSGSSTAWFALAAQKWGGRVISLEHEEKYRQRTAGLLSRLGVAEQVDLVEAPLIMKGGAGPWYDVGEISQVDLDVLFVDGPPSYVGKHARLPAFGAFQKWLLPGSLVVLDDTVRQDELEVGNMWLRQGDGQLQLHEKLGGSSVFVYFSE